MYVSTVFQPVANALAAGAESVMIELEQYVRAQPTDIWSIASGIVPFR